VYASVGFSHSHAGKDAKSVPLSPWSFTARHQRFDPLVEQPGTVALTKVLASSAGHHFQTVSNCAGGKSRACVVNVLALRAVWRKHSRASCCTRPQ